MITRCCRPQHSPRAGENKYDSWSVTEDGEYHESGRAGEQTRELLEQL